MNVYIILCIITVISNICAYLLTWVDVREYGAEVEASYFSKKAFAGGWHRKKLYFNICLIIATFVGIWLFSLVNPYAIWCGLLLTGACVVDAVWDLAVFIYFRM